jgi:hypothetical protein
MREVAPIRFDGDPTLSLDSIAWEGIEDVVRSFRRALVRGENPAIEEYVPERVPYRTVVVIELIQEEMEFQIKAGQPSGLSASWSRPSRSCRDAWHPCRGNARLILGRTALRPSRRSALAGMSCGM